MKTQQVVDHGGLADTPRPQEQNHGLGGDLTICTVGHKDRHRKRRLEIIIKLFFSGHYIELQ